MNRIIHLLACCWFVAFFACVPEDSDSPPDPVDTGEPQLVNAFPGLSFNRPLEVVHAGDGTDRLFVVEQRGVISVFPNQAGTEQRSVFLNLENQVEDAGNEEGLLGLAFHPDYDNNGYFFVNYTASNPDRTVVSRFTVSASDPNRADPGTEMVLLEIDQPFSNHNGGHLAFGPDGFLYVSVGDGGSGGDPQNHGQNPQTLLGAILRVDVDVEQGNLAYGIPADNPFAGNQEGIREELFAYGLRNVWKFSFDPETGALWAADVGQNRFEEISLIENGGNYGWNTMEGMACFSPSSNCSQEGLELPIWTYDHSQGDVSVTGGYVYRGTALPELAGQYIFGDFASGRIWAMDFSVATEPKVSELMQASFPVASFGLDQQGELLICGFDGSIYRIDYSAD